MQFANSFHLLSSLESLSIVDNEKQMFIFLGEQASQHVQCNLLHYDRLIPVTSPKKFAVISAVRTVPQRLDESVDGTAMTDADRQYHGPEIAIDMSRNLFFDRGEKMLQFFGNFADGNHTASMLISTSYQDTYRQMRLFLLNHRYHQNSFNRSV
jgi:hypothetical protein